MKKVAVLLLLMLGGCQTLEESRAAQRAAAQAQDDQKCQGFGARPGTDAYVNCRAQLDSARTNAAAIEEAAPPRQQTAVPGSDAPRIQPMNFPGPRCTSRGC